MNYSYTVQDGDRVVYEGPVENNAVKMWKKITANLDEKIVNYKVLHNDKLKFFGNNSRAATRAYYDQADQLSYRHKADTVRLEAWQGERFVAYVIRPFEERLLGGDAQHSRTGTQFGG